jgi:hypothetical protein
MKWGVRRFQNYDGSYTKKGMQRYRESESNYENAKERYKTAKRMRKETKKYGNVELRDSEGNTHSVVVTKEFPRNAKKDLKAAKRQLSKDYDQLKRDKAGDIGKELYRSGKTITGNENKLRIAGLIASGTALGAKLLYENGQKDLAKYAVATGVGLEAVNGIMAAKGAVEAHYLRAYYGHHRD